MRGSLAAVIRGPGIPLRMVRNFRRRKGRKPRPTRSCAKQIGRPDSSQIAAAISASKGESTIRPTALAAMSIARFSNAVHRNRAGLAMGSDDFPHRRDHALDLFVAQARVERQRHQPRIFRQRALAGIAQLERPPVVGMQRDRDEVNAAPDSAIPHPLDELGAPDLELFQAQPQGVQMPGVLRIAAHRGKLQFIQGRERFVIAPGDLCPPRVHPVQLAQLDQPDGRLDVTQVVLEAALDHLVVPAPALGVAIPGTPAHAVQGQHAHPLGQREGGRRDHAALARRHVLVRVKAEADGVAGSCADLAPAILGPRGMSRVLDDLQTVLCGQRPDRVHPARQAAVVHGQDGPGARRDHGLDVLGIEIEIVADIGEHRGGAGLQDHVDGGAEGERRGDHLVARPDAHCGQRQMHGGRTRVHGQRVLRARVRAESRLELRALRPGGHPPGGQHLGDRRRLLRAQIRRGKGDEGGHVNLGLSTAEELQYVRQRDRGALHAAGARRILQHAIKRCAEIFAEIGRGALHFRAPARP
jgi:hypothetical protein